MLHMSKIWLVSSFFFSLVLVRKFACLVMLHFMKQCCMLLFPPKWQIHTVFPSQFLKKKKAYCSDLHLNRCYVSFQRWLHFHSGKSSARTQTFGDFEADGISILHFERGEDFSSIMLLWGWHICHIIPRQSTKNGDKIWWNVRGCELLVFPSYKWMHVKKS